MPTKFTKEIQKQFLELIKNGNFLSVSAQACGISRTYVYEFARNNPRFAIRLEKVKGERISTLIKAIKTDKSWQSKAWMLERVEREKYHLPSVAEKELSGRLSEIEKKLDKYLDIKREKINGGYATAQVN